MRLKMLLPLTAMLLWSATAEAQTPPSGAAPAAASPAPASSPPPATGKSTPGGRNKGMMLRGGFGVDGCYDGMCILADADPLLYLRMQALFRIHKYFAAGLHVSFNFGLPDDEDNMDTDVFWSLIIGAEGRGVLPIKDKYELWGGMVLGYGRAMWDYETRFMGTTESYSSWADAFALGWGVGFDYFVRPNIAIGASLYHYRLWPRKGCTENGDRNCDKLSSDERQFFGAWWTLGFAFTYFIPF